MANIPSNVEKLLERRAQLALELISTCAEIDAYCARIGMLPAQDDACLCSDLLIYTEPWAAKELTKSAIERQLAKNTKIGDRAEEKTKLQSKKTS